MYCSSDPPDSTNPLKVCYRLGIDRILSSGAQASAAEPEALSTLKAMVEKAAALSAAAATAAATKELASVAPDSGFWGVPIEASTVRPVVMAGGGVTAANVTMVVAKTGVKEVSERVNDENY